MEREEKIKSAFEKAWERVEGLEAKEEKVQELEYLPQGARLVAKYLEEEKYDLLAALSSYDQKVRAFVAKGVESTLLDNIYLPRNERDRQQSKRAIEGLSLLKKSKNRVAGVTDRIEQLFHQYELARRQIYDRTKAEFEAAIMQALQQQLGTAVRANVNVENHPEFQQRWHQIMARLNFQYEEALKELKQQLSSIL